MQYLDGIRNEYVVVMILSVISVILTFFNHSTFLNAVANGIILLFIGIVLLF